MYAYTHNIHQHTHTHTHTHTTSPSPCGNRLMEDEQGGAVVAMDKTEVLDIDHRLLQSPQIDGVAGENILTLSAMSKR